MLSKTLAPSYLPVQELSHSSIVHDVTVTPVFRKHPLLLQGNSGKLGEWTVNAVCLEEEGAACL